MSASRSGLTARASLVFALPALLSACATAPGTQLASPTLRPAQGADMSDLGLSGASTYGLFLAGSAALEDGAAPAAAFYFGRASLQTPDADVIKVRAFEAALAAGEVDRAVTLAPGPGKSDEQAYALGALTRVVADLSEGRGREAYALIIASPMGAHWAAATLLTPWAAAAAGNWTAATAQTPAGKDRAVAAFGDLGRALLLEKDGQPGQAEAVYMPLSTKGGVFALAYGGFLERRSRGADAVVLYDRGLAKDPTDPAFVAARARVSAGRAAPALPSIKGGAAQALLGPAALLLAQRRSDAGIAYLRLALKLDPTLDEAWVLIGDALDGDGDPAGARKAYLNVAPGSAEYATAQGRIALNLQSAGDKAGALAAARATLKAAPHDPQALVVLADLLRADEQYDEAVHVLDRLIAESAQGGPAANSRLYYLRGASLERAGRWDDAQSDLQRAMQLKPDDPEILNYLGFGWANRGQHLDQALQMLEKATMIAPDSGAIVDSLGWAYYRLGEYPKSVVELERAVALDPADPDINDHLGDAYWRTGRQLEARYQWRRVLTLEPDESTRAAIQTKLTSGPKLAAPAAPDAVAPAASSAGGPPAKVGSATP